MTDEMTMPKRRMGTSHWDKKLIANMVSLSNANNYEEAHKEWIATGDVWWRGNGEVPAWIQSNSHPNECLCGHGIVYHFRIQNTENGNEEVVGSDHINSYLIIRSIERETGMKASEITEELIQQWLNVRVKGMKAESWWKQNGEAFERMFNTVKEADLRYNTRVQEWVYDSAIERTKPIFSLIKKKASGEDMASIVWRWNHPDNSRAQINSRGYPNDALMHDLSMFYIKCLTGLNDKLQAEKDAREQRIAEVEAKNEERRLLYEKQAKERAERQRQQQLEQAEYEAKMRPIWEAERKERERKEALREAKEKKDRVQYLITHGSKSDSMLEYYGLEPINWEKADVLSLQEIKTLTRYLSNIKNLDGGAIRRIANLARRMSDEE